MGVRENICADCLRNDVLTDATYVIVGGPDYGILVCDWHAAHEEYVAQLFG